jgi:hypothetical protein
MPIYRLLSYNDDNYFKNIKIFYAVTSMECYHYFTFPKLHQTTNQDSI